MHKLLEPLRSAQSQEKGDKAEGGRSINLFGHWFRAGKQRHQGRNATGSLGIGKGHWRIIEWRSRQTGRHTGEQAIHQERHRRMIGDVAQRQEEKRVLQPYSGRVRPVDLSDDAWS